MSAESPQAPITTAYIKPCFIYQEEKAFFLEFHLYKNLIK